jgi:hypothetical protein
VEVNPDVTIIVFFDLIPKPRQFWKTENDRVGTICHFTKARLQATHLTTERIREIQPNLRGHRNR